MHKDCWIVVFQCNAKNRLGGYVGLKNYYILLKADGSIDAGAMNDPWRAFFEGMRDAANNY
jgi:hypothetical protein